MVAVRVGLGTDVCAGTCLSPLRTMGEAYKIGELCGNSLCAADAYFLATRGAAESLHLEDKIGSIAPGMEADLVVLDLKSTPRFKFRMKFCKLFVELLKKLMHRRKKRLHLVLDGLPAHKTKLAKTYAASTRGRLTFHFLPGYAPELNPDELVWSHAKRTGNARRPLQRAEKPEPRIAAQLNEIGSNPKLVHSFFGHPSVAYITDL